MKTGAHREQTLTTRADVYSPISPRPDGPLADMPEIAFFEVIASGRARLSVAKLLMAAGNGITEIA